MTRARDLANLTTHIHTGGDAYVKSTTTATAGQTTVTGLTYTAGFVDVYLNGVKLLIGTDVTATNGTSIVLASAAVVGDIIQTLAFSGDDELAVQIFSADGGSANATYTSAQTIDGGGAGG